MDEDDEAGRMLNIIGRVAAAAESPRQEIDIDKMERNLEAADIFWVMMKLLWK